jgi:hypothetical protein
MPIFSITRPEAGFDVMWRAKTRLRPIPSKPKSTTARAASVAYPLPQYGTPIQ